MLRITALARGGLSVYGGLYDPHRDEAVIQVRDGETSAVVIEYPSAPTAVATTGTGITTTAPTVSGLKASLTLSGMTDGGRLDVTATVGGSARLIRIRARGCSPVDRYDCGSELV